jgi:hypothetical protein
MGLAAQRDCVRMVQSEEYPSGDLSDVMARWGFLFSIASGETKHIRNEDGLRYDYVTGRHNQEADEAV